MRPFPLHTTFLLETKGGETMQVTNSSLSEPIRPMTMAANSQRGLGGFPFSEILDAVTSGIGDSPTKDSFDRYRQQLWERFLPLDQSYAQLKSSGNLTRDQLDRLLTELQGISTEHVALYNSMAGRIDASWLDSRFRDFQSVYDERLNRWKTELMAMPTGLLDALQRSITGSGRSETGATQLSGIPSIVGIGLAVGIGYMLWKGRR